MAPTPIHGQGARRRLARQLREAALRSTPCELLALDAIEAAARAGHLTVPDASERIRLMLREQHQRDTKAA